MKRLQFAALSLTAAFTLTACGSGSTAGGVATEAAADTTTPPAELTPIEVGVIPIVDVAPIYLGVEEGVFEKHGLDVTLTQAQGGAAIVPAVQSGQMDFGFSNVTSLIIGRDVGLPLKIVAPGPQSTGDPETDFAAVVAPGDSGITSVEDLQGKRVAVNTLNNILDTTVSEGVRQAGGDSDTVEYVEIAPSEMLAQLESGNVDAINTSEPFLYLAEQGGAKRVYGMFAEPIESLTVSSYFTTDQKIEQDPELVGKFAAAIQESQQLATDEPDKVLGILDDYMTLDAEVIEGMSLPVFPQKHNISSLERLAELLHESGVIDSVPATDDLIMANAGE